jgi:hypothetical protein
MITGAFYIDTAIMTRDVVHERPGTWTIDGKFARAFLPAYSRLRFVGCGELAGDRARSHHRGQLRMTTFAMNPAYRAIQLMPCSPAALWPTSSDHGRRLSHLPLPVSAAD